MRSSSLAEITRRGAMSIDQCRLISIGIQDSLIIDSRLAKRSQLPIDVYSDNFDSKPLLSNSNGTSWRKVC